MLRTHTCGELRINHINQEVTLCGWVQKNRDLGALTFIDLRDHFGITQLVFNMDSNPELCLQARELGREFVVSAKGIVKVRSSKNKNIDTGEIEIEVFDLKILNSAKTPPFTIEDNTDGGDELRMKFRYLDLRRKPLHSNIVLRHKTLQAVRNFLTHTGFTEIETPFLIKSTPEGARDFVVPSRMHPDSFYALPQSPQTFKQLLMMSGFDRYFQIVKCFRDEDLRADRQPEFTQIDCELSFIELSDVYQIFTEMVKTILKEVKNIDLPEVPFMTYADAMKFYGSDKPDLRFDDKISPIFFLENSETVNQFPPFAEAIAENGSIAGIVVKGKAEYTRKQLDALTEKVKSWGLKGLFYIKHNADQSLKSSADKFFTTENLEQMAEVANSNPNDLLLMVSGKTKKIQKVLGDLRLYLAEQENYKDNTIYKPLWVTDFPMFEYNEETDSFTYMHHPFTSPNQEDIKLLKSGDLENVRALAYDFVLNGKEVGGGSIRIHDSELQALVFKTLGISDEEAKDKFGFLLQALSFGAPPHGGIAFGLDRLVAIMAETDSIRDVIAFPKNNAGRDLMLDAPAPIDEIQKKELGFS
jgi:aspartyl-tRNA synthetase